MIICFSGTGNTRYLAKVVSSILGDEVVRVAPGFYRRPDKFEVHVFDERVIWMFPTHCWGLPKFTRLIMENIVIKSDTPVKHYMITTCGDDIGNCDKMWRKVMRRRGFDAVSAYSVIMPNIYIMMKGFDVDPKELAEEKCRNSEQRIRDIAEDIEHGTEKVNDVTRGRFAFIKSSIIYPWFQRFKHSTKPFHTNDNCGGCGSCTQICPSANIKMNKATNRPVWGDLCTMCSRCIHGCPRRAIEYGNKTQKKGRYVHSIFYSAHSVRT